MDISEMELHLSADMSGYGPKEATLQKLLRNEGQVINLRVYTHLDQESPAAIAAAELVKALLVNDKVVSVYFSSWTPVQGSAVECLRLFADGVRATSALQEFVFRVFQSYDDACKEMWVRALEQNRSIRFIGLACDVYSPYLERMDEVQLRNTRGRQINRMISNGVSDGEWDVSECPMEFVRALLPTKFGLQMAFFNPTQDRCFCVKCHKARGDSELDHRGEPPAAYALPVSWCRFGLHVDQGVAEANQVFERWHVCYHGTKFQNVSRILEGGGRLLIAGDVALGGAELRIPEGHIQKPFQRRNKFTGEVEMFDPHQIYTSPSIRYSGCTCYASVHYFDHEKAPGKYVRAQFAFAGRQRPGSYGVGQETVGAGDQRLDPHIRNEELEWYTKEGPAIMLTGLLVKVELVKR